MYIKESLNFLIRNVAVEICFGKATLGKVITHENRARR